MYVYFDKNGTLREIINDDAIRQGNSNVNSVYAYMEGDEGEDQSQKWWSVYQLPSGDLTNETAESGIEILELPYDRKRELKWFKYFTEYRFHVFKLPDEVLSQSGTSAITIRVASAADNSILALGKIPFVVEDEVIKSDHNITQSQYNYLIERGGTVYFVPHVDVNVGYMYWTNNGGLENPEPVPINGPYGDGVVETRHIADRAVTPEKLDRGYLPILGGSMNGSLNMGAYPLITSGHFEVTASGDMLVAGASTFTGSVQMNGSVSLAGEGNMDVYKDAYYHGTIYANIIRGIGGNISCSDTFKVYAVSSGGNYMDSKGLTVNKISTASGALAVSIDKSTYYTYTIGGQLYAGGPWMQPGILATDAYVMDKINDEDEKIAASYLPKLTPLSKGDYAYISSLGESRSDGLLAISQNASPSTLARYDDEGRLYVASPSDRAHSANKGYVDDAISSIKSGAYKEVDELPSTGEAGSIYLVPDGSGNKEQYIWQNEEWLSLGDTSFQADNYYTKAQADDLLNGKLSASAGAVKPSSLDPNGDYSVGSAKLNKDTVYTSENTIYHFDPSKGGEVATTDDIMVQDNEVTTQKIADYAVTASKIDDGAVTRDKIADYNVNGDKLADSSVWNNHIQNGAVSVEKLDADLQSTLSKTPIVSEKTEYPSAIEAPSFLNLEGSLIKQSKIPHYASSASYPTTYANAVSQFGLGSYAYNGLQYGFLFLGDYLYVCEIRSKQSDGSVSIGEGMRLIAGAEVSCGDLLYKVKTGTYASGMDQSIWNILKPISCRFPLEPSFSNNVAFIYNMQKCDLLLKGSGTSRGGIHLGGSKNINITLDTTECNSVNDNNYMTFSFNAYGINQSAFYGLNKTTSDGKKVGTLSIAGQDDYRPTDGYDFTPALNTWSGSTNIGTSNDNKFPGTYTYVWLNFGNYDASNHKWHLYQDGVLVKSLKLNWKFDVDNNGTVSFDVVPYFVEPTATASANSIMTMSIDDRSAEQPKPVEINVPEGAIGIFSVDADGNTINAMTGEMVNG